LLDDLKKALPGDVSIEDIAKANGKVKKAQRFPISK
jgi:hypothetical protein